MLSSTLGVGKEGIMFRVVCGGLGPATNAVAISHCWISENIHHGACRLPHATSFLEYLIPLALGPNADGCAFLYDDQFVILGL